MTSQKKISTDQKAFSPYEDSAIYKIYQGLCVTYPDETAIWFCRLGEIADRLIYRWKLTDIRLLPGSSLGIILEAHSGLFHQNAAVKIIPPYIARYEAELAAYQTLSPAYMCPLLDHDDAAQALLLKKIEPGVPFHVNQDRELLHSFFDVVYHNTFPSSEASLSSYFQLYDDKVLLAQKNGYLLELRTQYVAQSKRVIDRYFKNDDLYFIHGGLHSRNVLKGANRFYAIDPLGFLAPRDFIFVRFAIFQIVLSENIAEWFHRTTDFLSDYIDRERFTAALFVDTVMAIHTGIIQDHDEYKLVNAFLKLAKFLLRHAPFILQ